MFFQVGVIDFSLYLKETQDSDSKQYVLLSFSKNKAVRSVGTCQCQRSQTLFNHSKVNPTQICYLNKSVVKVESMAILTIHVGSVPSQDQIKNTQFQVVYFLIFRRCDLPGHLLLSALFFCTIAEMLSIQQLFLWERSDTEERNTFY